MSHSSVLSGNEWRWDLVALVVQSTEEVSHTLSVKEQNAGVWLVLFPPHHPWTVAAATTFQWVPFPPCFQGLPAGTARAATKSELLGLACAQGCKRGKRACGWIACNFRRDLMEILGN